MRLQRTAFNPPSQGDATATTEHRGFFCGRGGRTKARAGGPRVKNSKSLRGGAGAGTERAGAGRQNQARADNLEPKRLG